MPLSALMTYVKNTSNWPDPGGRRCDMSQNYSLRQHKGNFVGKLKATKTNNYAQNIVLYVLEHQIEKDI